MGMNECGLCRSKVERDNRKWVFMEIPYIHGGRGNSEGYPRPIKPRHSPYFNISWATIFLNSLRPHISYDHSVKVKE